MNDSRPSADESSNLPQRLLPPDLLNPELKSSEKDSVLLEVESPVLGLRFQDLQSLFEVFDKAVPAFPQNSKSQKGIVLIDIIAFLRGRHFSIIS